MTTQAKIISYDQDLDTFNISINGHVIQQVDSALLPLDADEEEPIDSIGKTKPIEGFDYVVKDYA